MYLMYSKVPPFYAGPLSKTHRGFRHGVIRQMDSIDRITLTGHFFVFRSQLLCYPRVKTGNRPYSHSRLPMTKAGGVVLLVGSLTWQPGRGLSEGEREERV